MTKITKITRLPDYVRFSYDVEIEAAPQLVINYEVSGSVDKSQGPLLGYLLVETEDWYSTKITFLGKEVNEDEFKVLYDKVFKDTFKEMKSRCEEVLDKSVQEHLQKDGGNVLALQSQSRLKGLLQELVYEQDSEVCSLDSPGGKLYSVHTGWPLRHVAGLIQDTDVKCLTFNYTLNKNTGKMEESRTYGISREDINKLINQ